MTPRVLLDAASMLSEDSQRRGLGTFSVPRAPPFCVAGREAICRRSNMLKPKRHKVALLRVWGFCVRSFPLCQRYPCVVRQNVRRSISRHGLQILLSEFHLRAATSCPLALSNDATVRSHKP